MDLRVERRGMLLIQRVAEFSHEQILDALNSQGEMLKTSPKSHTRRVGAWVIKESLAGNPFSMLKFTFQRKRHRRGWQAACYLTDHGIKVPRPIAFIERGGLGLLLGNAVVSAYLDGYANVEHHARALAEKGAPATQIHGFLQRLADAVNALCATGAYHADLSGKNIFTVDGSSFCFIDLDAVILGHPYPAETRLKNHVQLYDSFCDVWNDDFLAPFIGRMLPQGINAENWMRRVRETQAKRRARTEAIWARRGR